MFRNGESSKENEKKSKLSVSNILEDLKTSATTKKLAEKSTKAVLKTIDDCIKGLEKLKLLLVKKMQEKDDKIELRNATVSAIVEVTSFTRTNRENILFRLMQHIFRLLLIVHARIRLLWLKLLVVRR